MNLFKGSFSATYGFHLQFDLSLGTENSSMHDNGWRVLCKVRIPGVDVKPLFPEICSTEGETFSMQNILYSELKTR